MASWGRPYRENDKGSEKGLPGQGDLPMVTPSPRSGAFFLGGLGCQKRGSFFAGFPFWRACDAGVGAGFEGLFEFGLFCVGRLF